MGDTSGFGFAAEPELFLELPERMGQYQSWQPWPQWQPLEPRSARNHASVVQRHQSGNDELDEEAD